MDDDVFDAISRAEDSGDPQVRLDISRVMFMSSEMIAKLIRAQKLAKELGIEIVIVNASANIHEVFNITRLNKVFKFEAR